MTISFSSSKKLFELSLSHACVTSYCPPCVHPYDHLLSLLSLLVFSCLSHLFSFSFICFLCPDLFVEHNPPESLVKSQIARVVKIVLCELRLERKPRSMSSRIHYLLFSLIFCYIFCDTNPFPLFRCILHILKNVFSCFQYYLPKLFSLLCETYCKINLSHDGMTDAAHFSDAS